MVKNTYDDDVSIKSTGYTDKVKDVFKDSAINKKLMQNLNSRELPRYIFEWLASHFMNNGSMTSNGQKELYELIDNSYPDPDHFELVKHEMIKEHKALNLLNHYQVQIDSRTEEYSIWFPFFGKESNLVKVSPNIISENKSLLLNGIWGIANIIHAPSNNTEKPYLMTNFSPVQILDDKIDEFIKMRKNFTRMEWINLLINTMGLNPEEFPDIKKKIYLISRLFPYVENNYNLIEMGPKGTGKSFLHKNMSNYSHVVSGGIISRAQLFYHQGTHQKGIILKKDVVILDDFSNLKFRSTDEVIGKLKNYMADGSIDVGKFKEPSKASIVVMGNVEINRHGKPMGQFFFNNLPKSMQEPAFLDRFCGFIPGWDIPAVGPKHLAVDFGLINDWFAEIMHAFRRKNYSHLLNSNIKFYGDGIRKRDTEFMKRTASALIKLLFPDERMTIDDWDLIGDVCVDLRNRIIEQLGISDYQFSGLKFDYEIPE